MTHTLATMDVTALAFDEIAAKLLAAGYDHAFLDHEDPKMLDMTGIGLTREPDLQAEPVPEGAAWIVERLVPMGEGEPPMELYLTLLEGLTQPVWANAAADGIRFARERDAKAMLQFIGGQGSVVPFVWGFTPGATDGRIETDAACQSAGEHPEGAAPVP